MKKLFVTTLIYFLSNCVEAQTFEKNAKESNADFAKRILPSDESMEFKVIENKFGTPVKKIIYFSKKSEMDTSINKDKKTDCLYANILIPEDAASNKYALQALLIDCNRDYQAQIDNAYPEKDKQKDNVLTISFCQLNRASTRLLLKTYKTFHLKQYSENSFTIEEVKE